MSSSRWRIEVQPCSPNVSLLEPERNTESSTPNCNLGHGIKILSPGLKLNHNILNLIIKNNFTWDLWQPESCRIFLPGAVLFHPSPLFYHGCDRVDIEILKCNVIQYLLLSPPPTCLILSHIPSAFDTNPHPHCIHLCPTINPDILILWSYHHLVPNTQF